MLDWYQHIPERINPIVFSVGFFSLRWYAVMYMIAILIGMFLFWRRLRRNMSFETYLDLISLLLIGMIVGSRLGYVFLYYPSFYWTHPQAIIWPFDVDTGAWTGIAGMSYFGGLIGVIISTWIFSKKQNISFWKLADSLAFSVPLAYFFGRIGNFLNGELYGRTTDVSWGMYFLDTSGNILLRHPSQLYEAFFEGVVIFAIIFIIWKYVNGRYLERGVFGLMALAYIVTYCIFRFGIEFVREPDIQTELFFDWMTDGQMYSIVLGIACAMLLIWKIRKVNEV